MKIVGPLFWVVFLGSALPGFGADLAVHSSAFRPGELIPRKFTCHGANESPPLAFKGVPPSAKSLAIVLEDPDAPGGLFTHWLAWNIEPGVPEVKTASVPSGAVQGRNDFGKIGYGGPCPPSGVHRYVFRVLALDRKLDLRAGAKRGEFDRAVAGHVIAQGEMTARFGR
jgi:hypothetical protein